MSFQFRLEKVLSLRKSERQQRRAELAEALQAERILQGEANKVDLELKQLKRTGQEAASPGAVDVGRLLDISRYELVLRQRLAEVAQHNQQLQVEIQRRRERLVGADQQVRVLEKLRDRQQAAYVQDELRSDAKVMDEIAQVHTERARQ